LILFDVSQRRATAGAGWSVLLSCNRIDGDPSNRARVSRPIVLPRCDKHWKPWQNAFADYRKRKVPKTIRRQEAGLFSFAQYLAQTVGSTTPSSDNSVRDPEACRGVTWDLLDGYTRWLLLSGYAVGTVNVRLSIIKTHKPAAAKAGAIPPQESAMILPVGGYGRQEGKRVDERREGAATIPTRQGTKEVEPRLIAPAQARKLKDQPDTRQGCRDTLLVCLLLDHGLRASEAAGLSAADLDPKAGEMRFHRPKVDKEQTRRLTPATLDAAHTYIEHDALAVGPLLRASHKGGKLARAGLTTRAVIAWERALGKRLGIENLSAHDLCHYWATQAARCGTPINLLQQAGGWASPAMPLHYVEAAKTTNEGVRLDRGPFPYARENQQNPKMSWNRFSAGICRISANFQQRNAPGEWITRPLAGPLHCHVCDAHVGGSRHGCWKARGVALTATVAHRSIATGEKRHAIQKRP
jgi:integrase